MDHPAFAEAGQAPGIEIWTIDKFEPVAIDQSKYGKFYNGDSYIVLKTKGDTQTPLTYDAHFWLGSQATQDKVGAAAILTVALDDSLGGRAVHRREVQGHESQPFLAYFKPAIRYLEGGLESGFTQVETNAGAEKRLLKLTGSDHMRIEEVPPEASSLNRDNCFILENEHDIFVLMPEVARATQRRKIISVANTLRDDYHNGRAAIEIIDEFSSDEDVALFFEALGSGSKDELADDSGSEDYSRDGTAVYLYKVLLGDDIELVDVGRPYRQKQLSSEDIFILDTPDSGVFLWIGNDVESETKKNYNDVAQKYLDVKGYPSWFHVTRVSQGAECSSFKQYFQTWDTLGAAGVFAFTSVLADFSGTEEEVAQGAKLIGKSAPVRGYMPGAGAGALTVTRIAGDQEDITEAASSDLPILYQSEAYVVQYQYEDESGADAYVIYCWVGKDTSDSDKLSAFEFVSQLEDELGENVTTVKVPQGKEPKHFLSIFKGNLVILFGQKDSEYAPDNANHNYDDTNVRLFRVEGTAPGVDMRAAQAAEAAGSLADDGVFVLETAGSVYVRFGKESEESENEAALNFTNSIVKSKEVVSLNQGEEPEEFWEALGGQPEDKEDNSSWKATVNRRVNSERSLYAVTVKLSGKIVFDNLTAGYTQEDLSDDGLYVLDTGEEIFLWKGRNIPERVRFAVPKIVEEFLDDDGLGRSADSALVVAVRRGAEPNVFTDLFPEWDQGMWDNQSSYDDIKNEVKAGNA